MILRAAVVAVGISSIPAAQAALNIQFEYGDAQGTGFLDPVNGPSWQAAMNTAAMQFSSMFGSHFSNSGTIILQATSSNDPGSNTLASAGSEVIDPGAAGFNLGEVVRTKLLTGVDLNGAAADGSVDINFGNSWELDYNVPASSSKYDFYSTLFHEFTHTLGFISYTGEDGSPLYGTPDSGSWSTFDRFIVDSHGNRVIDPSNYSLDQAAWQEGSTGGASPAAGLFFDGANAVAANGGELVGLYTPGSWNEGSSVSHLDDDNPALAGMMMLSASDTGPYARDYSAIEVGMLADLGYAAVVPEPETYAMLLAGLGVLGCVARRRKKAGRGDGNG
jgi:hypothetical protein